MDAEKIILNDLVSYGVLARDLFGFLVTHKTDIDLTYSDQPPDPDVGIRYIHEGETVNGSFEFSKTAIPNLYLGYHGPSDTLFVHKVS